MKRGEGRKETAKSSARPTSSTTSAEPLQTASRANALFKVGIFLAFVFSLVYNEPEEENVLGIESTSFPWSTTNSYLRNLPVD
jgi:hypothetical protein